MGRLLRQKPAAVRPGDVVAVVAPGSPPVPENLEAGIRRIRETGLGVEKHVSDRPVGYLSGTDADRSALLNGVLARDDVRALVCARGGFGALRILRSIDFHALEEYPKAIVGYSDITALQLAALRIAGTPSLSASMVAIDWPTIRDEEADMIASILSGTCSEGLFADEGVVLIGARDGEATGPLVGGNLTIICRLIGTPYLPDMKGAILFLEEVGEAPYRVDGLFSQLLLSGVLDEIGGLVLGAFTESAPPEGQASLEIEEVLQFYAGQCPCPVATGLPYGHIKEKLPVPIGIDAELTVAGSRGRLRVLEQLTRGE